MNSVYIEGYLRLHIDKGIAVFKNSKQIIIENSFDEIGSFVTKDRRTYKYIDKGYSIVKRNGKVGAVNSDGLLIIPLLYDKIELLELSNSGWKRESSILIANNEDGDAFYKSDKSLQKLEYSYILTEMTEDNLYIASKDKIPMKYKSIGDLRSFEIWGDKMDVSQIIEVTDEELERHISKKTRNILMRIIICLGKSIDMEKK